LTDRILTAELLDCLGVLGVNEDHEVVAHGRLRWYRYVERKDKSDWVSACKELQVEGIKSRRRSKKT